jgi:hypothetical protein
MRVFTIALALALTLFLYPERTKVATNGMVGQKRLFP